MLLDDTDSNEDEKHDDEAEIKKNKITPFQNSEQGPKTVNDTSTHEQRIELSGYIENETYEQ